MEDKMINEEIMSSATNLCRKIVSDLQAGNSDSIANYAAELKSLPNDEVFLAIKNEIGLKKILELQLDENPDFSFIFQLTPAESK